MSPFSKVEMSPFVVVKKHLQHERCGAGGSPTTDEPTRVNAAGSNPTSKAQDAQTTSSSRAVVTVSASGKTSLQSLPEHRNCGTDFETTRPTCEQSLTGKDHQQSAAVITFPLP